MGQARGGRHSRSSEKTWKMSVLGGLAYWQPRGEQLERVGSNRLVVVVDVEEDVGLNLRILPIRSAVVIATGARRPALNPATTAKSSQETYKQVHMPSPILNSMRHDALLKMLNVCVDFFSRPCRSRRSTAHRGHPLHPSLRLAKDGSFGALRSLSLPARSF
uniref:Uncharacterized protein n=1 Tax=Oryza punctata TaxID=4537 RepID=A0A0E0JLQ0_ORYPU